MNEYDALGAYAWGKPVGTACIKAVAENFQVEEVLELALTGAGEHLWLWVEKRYLNTEEVAKRLAKCVQVPVRQVGYAGLKDRQAITRQWFSIHLPGKEDPDFSSLENYQLRILKQTRHQRKLNRGAHSANRFIIELTGVQADEQALKARLIQISQQGVPNYFGIQRFGHGMGNLQQAFEFAQKGVLPKERAIRSRLLSTARSYLFNQVLSARVQKKQWNTLIKGDIVSFTTSRSFFPAEEDTLNDPRFTALTIHPTGPLWGEGTLATSQEALLLEQSIISEHNLLATWLERAGLTQERRVLRLPVQNLEWRYNTPNSLQLKFILPIGCFATVVIRELVNIENTENTCGY